jgi:hypothetical protein
MNVQTTAPVKTEAKRMEARQGLQTLTFYRKAKPALCTRRRSEIVAMVVPPGNHPAVARDWT